MLTDRSGLSGASRIAAVAFVGLLLTVSSTALLGASKDIKQAEKFRNQGESAVKSIEKARDQLQATVGSYDKLLGADEKKIEGAYKKLAGDIDKLDKAGADVRKQLVSLEGMAEGFFTAWEAQLGEIQTESIKAASEQRLQAARGLYKNMLDSLTAAGESYRPLLASLQEQSTLIAQDMTTDTLAILSKEAAPGIHSGMEEVLANIERSLSKEQASGAEMNGVIDEEQAADAGGKN